MRRGGMWRILVYVLGVSLCDLIGGVVVGFGHSGGNGGISLARNCLSFFGLLFALFCSGVF